MSTESQPRRESTAWTIGSVLGVLLGVISVLYLDHQKPKVVNSAAVSTVPMTQPSATLPPLPATIDVMAPVIREDTYNDSIREEATRTIAMLQLLPQPRTQPNPDIEQLKRLNPNELQNKVQSAVTDAAAYESEGHYLPEDHAQLYRRINLLWDLKGLSTKQNEWLAQAVHALNEMAVRNAEEAMRDGDIDAVLRTATSFGEWGYRLDDDQQKRLTIILQRLVDGNR